MMVNNSDIECHLPALKHGGDDRHGYGWWQGFKLAVVSFGSYGH